jgi:hypothetical protein
MNLATGMLLFCLSWLYACAASIQSTAPGGVLADNESLPLTIVSVSPPFLTTPSVDPLILSSTDSIRVVFSRAVLPIGADSHLVPSNHTPFTVSGYKQGKFRWLNSYVAEYGPEKEWLTDISMRIMWNMDLISWDGALLSSERLPVRPIKTPLFNLKGWNQ